MIHTLDMNEFQYLKDKYGKNAEIHPIHVTYTNKKFYNEFKHNIQYNRRGEVVFFVQRKNGSFILVRNNYYPQNLYRVPTGGINHGEKAEDALFREVQEELGLLCNVHRFLGVIEHNISLKGEQPLLFHSYVFWLKEESGTILTDATENEIGEYLEADKNKLIEAVSFLKNMEGSWKDWASFRYQSTAFILSYL